jgi:surfeit locus 1 family protein
MTARRMPIFSTIIVLAAVATMIGLGIWQLGRRAEKEALIARYEAAQAEEGISYIIPSRPEAAYRRTLTYCAKPSGQTVVSGRNARGQNGWVHVARCTIGGKTPNTREAFRSFETIMMAEQGVKRRMTDAEVDAAIKAGEEPAYLNDVVEPADVVLGWSRSPDPVAWSGGFVAGTIVPTGELGFKIVADPPLAGLEANAKPDPADLPNNHLAYAGQWFFFALTALVIYVLALRRRRG